MVTAAPHAQAAVTGATVARVAAQRAAPAVATVCVSGGPVAWGVCGVGTALALGGWAAWTYRDHWMPWLGSKLGSGTGPGSPGGSITMTWDPSPTLDPADGVVKYGIGLSNPSYYGASVPVTLSTVCVTATGAYAAFTGSANLNAAGTGPSGSGYSVYNLNACAAGQSLAALTVTPTAYAANSLTWAGQAGYTRAPDNGTAAEQAQADANAAAMRFRTEVTCKLPNGSVETIVVEASGAPVMPSCQTRFPGSEWDTANIWGGFDPSKIKDTPPATLRNDLPNRYPSCVGGVCVLDVLYRGNPCIEGATPCVDWSRRSLVEPADYTCRYGPYSVPISYCDGLERFYEVNGGSLPATKPNTDGDPDTRSPEGFQPSRGTPVPVVVPLTPTSPQPTPSPTGTGQPTPTPTYTLPPFWQPDPLVNPGAPRPNPTADPDAPADPQTDPYQYPDPNGVPNGQPGGTPQLDPNGNPIPGTSTGGSPGTGPGGAPAPGPSGDPLLNQGNSRCWPNGWGWFNPAEWVLRPLGCAFMPSPATVTRLHGINEDMKVRPPYTVAAGLFGFMASMEGGGGSCWVQTTSLPGIGQGETITVLDTCTPGPVEGAMMAYRPVLLAAIWIAILAPLAWWFWREYAPGSKGVA